MNLVLKNVIIKNKKKKPISNFYLFKLKIFRFLNENNIILLFFFFLKRIKTINSFNNKIMSLNNYITIIIC